MREGLAGRLRRAFFDLRTEYTGAGREAAAIGVGVFIGCTPFYGFHLLMCWAIGSVLRLNRLQVYLAANISNPVFAPFLVFAEVQTGALLRRGAFHGLSLTAVRNTDVRLFGLDYLFGALVFGAAFGAVAAAGTYAALRGPANDLAFSVLAHRASERYVATSITAWEFARGKLRADPVYRQALRGLLPSGRVLVDIGCGQGLMLALLAEAKRPIGARVGALTPCSFPTFERLVGIERRPRVAHLARQALGADAEILEQDVRVMAPESCSAVLLFDVLHMMPWEDQEALLKAMVAALEPGGVILVRDADRAGGWAFAAVQVVNRVKALMLGDWRRTFHFRTTREWFECFDRLGLDADVRPMKEGTPFANVLFRITVRQTGHAVQLL